MPDAPLPHAFESDDASPFCRSCGFMEYDPVHVPAVQTATADMKPTHTWNPGQIMDAPQLMPEERWTRKRIGNIEVEGPAVDLVQYCYEQREFSERTFGPGMRTKGLIDHIMKELVEIAAKPYDLEEWIDVVTLALDGAWRAGYSPSEIANALTAKLKKNKARTWPDWQTADPDKGIEHVKE